MGCDYRHSIDSPPNENRLCGQQSMNLPSFVESMQLIEYDAGERISFHNIVVCQRYISEIEFRHGAWAQDATEFVITVFKEMPDCHFATFKWSGKRMSVSKWETEEDILNKFLTNE